MTDLQNSDRVVLKCDPERALDLRDKYSDIEGAWHMNKKYWNQINTHGMLSDDCIKSLIRHSYAEVVKKLSKKIVAGKPSVLSING